MAGSVSARDARSQQRLRQSGIVVAKLAANLSWLFTELPFLERFAAAAACGFRAVELLYPYEVPARDVAAALAASGLELIQINVPPGDLRAGERGFAARPGDEARFEDGFTHALAYAQTCRCKQLHVMAGRRIEGISPAGHEATFIANLRSAARRGADAGFTLVIEPLNERDNPDYVLTTTPQAIAIIDAVAEPNVSLQLDLYHLSVTEGCIDGRIRELRGRYAHVQIAGCPDRQEPDGGTLDAHATLALLDSEGYGGWIALEYAPRTTTLAGLGWASRYL